MRRWYPALVVALASAASLAAYPRLPDRVPMHWNAAGEIDRWGSRLEAAVLMPLVLCVVALTRAARTTRSSGPRTTWRCTSC